MKIGFTGTRHGMNKIQHAIVARILTIVEPISEAHHGDCVGADAQFHELCVTSQISVILHPPMNTAHRAECQGATKVETPREYLERNRVIVNSVDCLLAIPHGPEKLRSGTWACVRYAKKCGRPVLIITPEGHIVLENSMSRILPESIRALASLNRTSE